jgi:hypothetical protein
MIFSLFRNLLFLEDGGMNRIVGYLYSRYELKEQVGWKTINPRHVFRYWRYPQGDYSFALTNGWLSPINNPSVGSYRRVGDETKN